MTTSGISHIVIFFLVVLAITKPLGAYMAMVFEGESNVSRRFFTPVERIIYRVFMVDPLSEMDWKRYAFNVLVFSGIGVFAVYAFLRLQQHLPLNPAGLPATSPQ